MNGFDFDCYNYTDSFPGLFYSIDPETGKYCDANELSAKYLGFSSKDDVIGKSNYDLFPKDVADKFSEYNMRLYNEIARVDYVQEVKDYRGDIRYLKIHGEKVSDKTGKALLVFFADDITEETKRVVEMQNELVRERTNSAIAELVEDYDIIDYADARDKENIIITNYRASTTFDELIPGWAQGTNGKPRIKEFIQKVVYEPDKYRVSVETSLERILAALENQTAYYVNFRVLINGEISYYQIKYTRNLDERGEIAGFICGIHNIDEIIRQESDNDKQISVIASMSDDFEFLGAIDTITDEMTVYRASEHMKKAVADLKDAGEMKRYVTYIKRSLPPDEEEMYSLMANKATVTDKLRYSSTYKFDTRFIVDGEPLYYRIKYTRNSKNPNLVVVGHLNIDEQVKRDKNYVKMEKELEYKEEIEKARDIAEAANKAKSKFLFNMSHDIRTPMNAITGFTSIAQKHIDDKNRVEDCLKKIEYSSEHLLKLINEILDMSRIESGNIIIDEQPVSAHSLLDITYSMCNEIAEKKEIKLTLAKRDIVNDKIYADELHVNQILMNVLSNAIKYTPNGGVVRCTLRQLPDSSEGYAKYQIVVDDTGIGMSEEFLKTIFDAFSRERNSTISGIEGTGLGMSIVKRLVDLLDGSIKISSKVGVGTRVEITLPFRIVENDKYMEKESQFFFRRSLKGKRVLLVEDNDLNREIAKDILSEEGMIVEEACDGNDAVTMMKEKMMENPFYYDFVLMDIQMPNMDGYEASKAIRKLPMSRYVHVPIIAMTANAFEEDKKKAVSAGMDAHLAKPVNIEVLLDTLSRF